MLIPETEFPIVLNFGHSLISCLIEQKCTEVLTCQNFAEDLRRRKMIKTA